jgi:hypothetical protein
MVPVNTHLRLDAFKGTSNSGSHRSKGDRPGWRIRNLDLRSVNGDLRGRHDGRLEFDSKCIFDYANVQT